VKCGYASWREIYGRLKIIGSHKAPT